MSEPLRMEKAVYGGDALGRTAAGEVVLVPFALPGELVASQAEPQASGLTILEASPDRVVPRCVHFGVCGGCQYQMASEAAQLRMKGEILVESLTRAGLGEVPAVERVGSPSPWRYRNRIRLRMRTSEGAVQLGYSRRGTETFLPVTMCPISTPMLWAVAEAMMSLPAARGAARACVAVAAEVELSCDDAGKAVMVHLLIEGKTGKVQSPGVQRLGEALQAEVPAVVSVVASRRRVGSGLPGEVLHSWGKGGLLYRVGDRTEDRFWLQPGSFFQVNRLLLPTMVERVCAGQRGRLAWDLYAGAGLFSRRLRDGFDAVVAVEASPAALPELARGLRPGVDRAVGETTLSFLRGAAVQRERPELVVLDPPRAGAGEESCRLLLAVRPPTIVYVSCDPTTLARDAAVLVAGGYRVESLLLLDLFPQTYHLETVMVLHDRGMRG